jgi:hypothetical protein
MTQDPKSSSSSPILPTLREQIEQRANQEPVEPELVLDVMLYAARLTLDAVEAAGRPPHSLVARTPVLVAVERMRAQLTAARPPHAAHEKDQGAL